MSRSGKTSWRWEKWISAAEEPLWAWRLSSLGTFTWSVLLRPPRRQMLLQAFLPERAQGRSLQEQWGGNLQIVRPETWLRPLPTPPLRIGKKMILVTEEKERQKLAAEARSRTLVIPAGLAFGTGEYATTGMLLRALAAEPAKGWPERSVWDVGTGSGVLALAARFWGARKIGALDFAPESIRAARENERRNFSNERVVWSQEDVLTWQAPFQAELVLANLFSGLLILAAPRIIRAVAPGGSLWLSGILHTQESEVVQAFTQLGWKSETRRRRGKWLVLQGRCVG